MWVVDRISIMYGAGSVNLWTYGPDDLWIVGCGQNINHAYSGRCGPVDLRTCGPVGCRQNMNHVCRRTCGPMGCGQLMYVAMGVHRIVGARIYVNDVVVDRSRRRGFALIM